MKIKILMKEGLDKIYNILPIIKHNEFLNPNQQNIEYFNESNWTNVFENVVEKITKCEIEKICIFDNDGILPFMFFTKHKGIIAATPTTLDRTRLCRAHNDANCLILSCEEIENKAIKSIVDMFFNTNPEGGRHALRIRLMQEPYSATNKPIVFNQTKKDTIVICSDHGGYSLKEVIKKYLIEDKHISVIDVGCFGIESCHYPLFAIAMVLNASKAFCGISLCSTGIGIANTLNKFKGINTAICLNAKQAQLAREKYNANVLAIGALGLDKKQAIEIVDKFISTENSNNELMKLMNNYGYKFDREKFNAIDLKSNTEIPIELKK